MGFIKQKFINFLTTVGLLKKMGREGFDESLARYASGERTLDIANGGSPYSRFFPKRVAVDIVKQPDTDVVADVHNLREHFKEGEFGVVLCTDALEHFYHPHKAVEEMHRVLKPGGVLILSTRFIFPLHEVPHDYFRFTEYGLKYLLRDFEIVEFHDTGGTMHTLGVLFQRIGFQADTLWFSPFKLLWFLKAKITPLFSFLLTKEYGEINRQNEVKHIMTSGYFVVARKK